MTSSQRRVIVRMERESDVPFVRFVVETAFGRALEADIVDAIRGTRDWLDSGSIVAVDDDGDVIGHVLLSRGRLVADDGDETVVGVIGPVAVVPEQQRRGVGGELMRAAISAAVALRFPIVALLGHPTYYPRFGFEKARALGIRPPDERWPDEAWMALRLPGHTPAFQGVVHFPPAFDADASA